MFLGSAYHSMRDVDGTLDTMSIFHPILGSQDKFHQIGFYLSILALIIGVRSLIKEPKNPYTIASILIASGYLLPRLSSYATYLP